jgi:hypothetical protein
VVFVEKDTVARRMWSEQTCVAGANPSSTLCG